MVAAIFASRAGPLHNPGPSLRQPKGSRLRESRPQVVIVAAPPASPNGQKNVKLCCRSRPSLVEGATRVVVRDDIFRDGECDEDDQFTCGSSAPSQYPLERGKSANCRVVAFCLLALRAGEPR
jgi:hypothetical protein